MNRWKVRRDAERGGPPRVPQPVRPVGLPPAGTNAKVNRYAMPAACGMPSPETRTPNESDASERRPVNQTARHDAASVCKERAMYPNDDDVVQQRTLEEAIAELERLRSIVGDLAATTPVGDDLVRRMRQRRRMAST